MKKLILLTLVLVFILSLAGCGEKAPKAMTFDDFDQKYRRADYEAFLADPSVFIDDLIAVNSYKYTSEDLPTNNGWEALEDINYLFKKDCVLFNKPFRYSATAMVGSKASVFMLTVEMESGDIQKDLDLAKALYFSLVKKYGDPDETKIDDETATEAELLKILDGTSEPVSFNADFHNCSVRFYAYKFRSDGHWASHVWFYAYPEYDEEKADNG